LKYPFEECIDELVFLFPNAILQNVERKNMLRNKRTIVLVTLLILAVAAPVMSFAETGKFKVARDMFIAGSPIKAGTYDVKSDASGSDASVVFTAQGKVEVQAKGKIEDGGKISDYNSLSVGKDSAGRDAIKALMFKGSKNIVVFD
jgi:hypothetical protein